MKTFPVLSIDAWRDGSGWTWNNWHKLGQLTIDPDMLDNPRKLLKAMREEGFLSSSSAGLVAVEDDCYNMVIVAKGTREPLYAIEYGSVF